jgi:hypothetical protein
MRNGGRRLSEDEHLYGLLALGGFGLALELVGIALGGGDGTVLGAQGVGMTLVAAVAYLERVIRALIGRGRR